MFSVFKDLAGKGLIYGLGSSLNGLIGFLLIPFFVNRLQAAEYGRFALAEMLLNLLLVILGLGLNVVLLSRYPKLEPGERRHFVGSLFTLVLVSTCLLELIYIALVYLFGAKIFPGLNKEIFSLILVISFIENIWMLFATLFRSEGKAWLFIIASLSQVVCGLLATIWLITVIGLRDEGILYGRLIGDAVLLVILTPQFFKYPPILSFKSAFSFLKIGVPLVPATFASIWILMSPRYFIGWFGTPSDVGIFAMSTKIAGLLSLGFVQPFSMAWMVSIFKIYKRPDAKQVYARVLTYFILVGGGLALALGIASSQIVALLGKTQFPLSTEVITIMALANVAAGLIYPVTLGPYVKECTHTVLPIYFFSCFTSVVLMWSMTYKFGVVGACSSLLLVYVIQSVLLERLSNKLYPVRIELVRIIKVIAVLIVSYFSCKLVSANFIAYNWALVIVFAMAVPLLLLIMKFYDKKEIDAFTTLINYRRAGKA